MEFIASFMDIFSVISGHNIQRPLTENEISIGVVLGLEEDIKDVELKCD